jgi:hypothetical protein
MSNNRFPLLGRMLLGAVVASISFGIQAWPRTESEPRITGTYSDMHYIEESGDLLGTETKIVFTGSELQGALPDRSGPSWGAGLGGRRCKGKLNSILYT